MKESIEIKNAGPLRNIRIDHVKPFTVLIGNSGSGKSVLMKTLMLMRYIYKMMNIRSALKNSGVKSPFRLHIKTLLHDDLINYFGPGKDGEVVYTVNDKYTIRITKGRLDTKDAERILSPDLMFLKESWVTDMRSAIPMWLDKRGALPDASFYFKETAEDFNKALDCVNQLDLPFLGMNMKVHASGRKRKVYLSPINGGYGSIELRHTSSGMQSSTPLLTLAEYFSNKFSFKDAMQRSIVSYIYMQDSLKHFRPDMEFSDMPRVVHMHIEEPELSLFPDAQCDMIEQLVKTVRNPADDHSVELTMATHSPYIVNFLNVLLRHPAEYPAALRGEEMGVYRLYDGELQNLMSLTRDNKWIVDTRDLSETMTGILDQYRHLNSR